MEKRMLQRAYQLRNLRTKLGEAGEPIVITGHAAVFNSLSEELWPGVRERIMPDAFRDVLENDVRLLLNHDPNVVFARTKAGTLKLSQDAVGLKIRAELPDTQAARDLVTSMKRGDIDSMSFAFDVDKEDVRSENHADGFILDTIYRVKRLYDVSVVTYPAYPAASAKVRAYKASASESQSLEALTALAEQSRQLERLALEHKASQVTGF